MLSGVHLNFSLMWLGDTPTHPIAFVHLLYIRRALHIGWVTAQP